MTRKQRRLTMIGGSLAVLAVAAALVLNAMRDSIVLVAEGALDASGVFKADTVLAKHDETYMPKEVADALKKQGHWKDDYGAKPDHNAKPAATPGASQVKQGVSQ